MNYREVAVIILSLDYTYSMFDSDQGKIEFWTKKLSTCDYEKSKKSD